MREKKEHGEILKNDIGDINPPVSENDQISGKMHTGQIIQRMSEPTSEMQMNEAPLDEKKGTITGGAEILAALDRTPYGITLKKILETSGLDYTININPINSGKFGDPKAIMGEDGKTVKGWVLNFQKYDKIELAGTRYDYTSQDEFYGGIAAHDVIDTSTEEGIKVNKQKDADWANEDSEFRKKWKAWQKAKSKNKPAARDEFIQFMIDNYEKVGMDAEFKFRDEFPGNTLDTKIGALSDMKQKQGDNPNLEGKTARDIYTKHSIK